MYHPVYTCVGNNNRGHSEVHQFDQRNFLKQQESLPPFLSSVASSEHNPDLGPTRVQALRRTPSEFLSKCLISLAGTLQTLNLAIQVVKILLISQLCYAH